MLTSLKADTLNHGWSLTRKERRAIESLGEAWLSQGATDFGFRINDRVIYSTNSEQQSAVLYGNVVNGGYHSNGNGNGYYPDQLLKPDSLSAQVTLHGKQAGILHDRDEKRLKQLYYQVKPKVRAKIDVRMKAHRTKPGSFDFPERRCRYRKLTVLERFGLE